MGIHSHYTEKPYCNDDATVFSTNIIETLTLSDGYFEKNKFVLYKKSILQPIELANK